MKVKLSVALALVALLQFSNVDAASIDRELAILASEQPQDETTTQVEEKTTSSTQKSQKDREAEAKKLREEQREAEKKLKAEKEAARKQIEAGRKEQVQSRDTSTRRTSNIERVAVRERSNVENSTAAQNDVVQTATVQSKPTTRTTTTQTQPSTGVPNPMVSYATFEELAKAVGFTPLYVPKKSGYTVNEIVGIDNKIAQVRYGRRWEPNVVLYIRTYKRAPGEELQDISGLNGLKWRVDTTSGTTVYVAKVGDSANAAAWAVGDYTFAAYVDNLSFAAFHALVVEELVDLSKHYYAS